MLRASLLFFILCFIGVSAHGQTMAEISAQLRSNTWLDREKAFHVLANRPPVSRAEAEAAIVTLLQTENSPDSTPAIDPDVANRTDHDGPLDYERYVSALLNSVMEIADREPQRSDVWRALLDTRGYGAPSKLSLWFAKHGDKTANYFLGAARSGAAGVSFQETAITVLAEMIAFERSPATKHTLASSDVQLLEETIRSPQSSSTVGVRMEAIKALGEFGTVADLQMLDRIAATDSYSEDGIYFYRIVARFAAQAIRTRITAPTTAK